MKTKHICAKFCLLTISMVVASAVGASAAFADGGAADGWDSGGDKTDNGWCDKDWDWDSCGAGFVNMSIDNPVALINSGNHSGYPNVRSYIQSTVVPACKKADATEFYLLALHVMSGGNPTGTFGNTRYVHQLKSVNNGGSGHIPYRAGSGAVAFSEARDNFFIAQGYAKDRVTKHPEERSKYESLLNTTWSNVTWFCWNPAWETQEAETSFGAFSLVVSDKLNSGNRNSTYPNVDSKKTWEITSNEDKVRVTFAHKFFYYGGNKLSSNTTEKASTNWGVIVTRDGKGYYEPDHVGRIDGSSFGGEFSLPGYNKSATYSGSNGSGCPGNICPEDIGVNTYDIDISNLGLGESTVVCSEISYDPKALLWRSENGGPFKIVKHTNANKSSTGCVKITRGSGENVEFWSNSSVRASYGSRTDSKTSPVDGNTDLTIRLDADDNSPVTVDFWHNIHYTGKIPENLNQDICTSFTFDSKSAIRAPTPPTIIDESSLGGNQYCANKHEPMSKDASETTRGSESDAVGKGSSVVIKGIKQGEKQVVCQTINYIPKSYLIFQDEKTKNVSVGEGSGSGSSTACVTIIKEEGVEPPKVEIKLDNDVYYAGETAHLSWTVSADSNYEKKLLEGVMFYYQAPVDVDPSSAEGIMEEKANQKDPKTYYGDKNNGFRDGNYKTVDFTPGFEHSFVDPNDYKLKDSAQDKIDGHVYHSSEIEPSMETIHFNDDKTIEIVVPDNVGDKICVGFATHYQNYKIEDSTETHRWRTGTDRWGYPIYTSEDHTVHQYVKDGEHYWLVEGATCRPIVKKPTINIWNGSISTQGGITTSIANRYTEGFFGPTSFVGDEKRHKFGSWSEYLAVVKGAVVQEDALGFGSGTSFSFKGAGTNDDLLGNSPLTISNSNSSSIGNSQVYPSSTYLARLSSYLYNNDKIQHVGLGEVMGGVNSGTKIVNIGSGDIISQNIVVDKNNKSSIYDLPQIILYSSGDVKISHDVTQIDAWIIAPNGNVYTCEEYDQRKEQTEAAVKDYRSENDAEAKCSKQLVINGPIIAQNMTLNRSAGADPITYNGSTLTDPLGANTDSRAVSGEVFNLSADVYLWSYAQASRYGSSYTEAYSRELPPRY